MNLIVGQTYTMAPTFIANSGRTARLTRPVRVVKVQGPDEGTPLVAVEYLNSGPFNDVAGGFLWTEGTTEWHDPAKWSFEPLKA